jgi:large subunit ribosomal protein L20
MRIKRGQVSRKRHQKVLKLTKSFRGCSSVLFRVSNQQKMKALRYAFHDRRQRKRSQRRLWISRINASVRQYGWSYGLFISKCKCLNLGLNRKWLSQMAIRDPYGFYQYVCQVAAQSSPS